MTGRKRQNHSLRAWCYCCNCNFWRRREDGSDWPEAPRLLSRFGTAAALISCSRKSSVSARASRWSWMTCGVIRGQQLRPLPRVILASSQQPQDRHIFQPGNALVADGRGIRDQPRQSDRLPVLHDDT
jgi:hypothetical protein